MDNDTPATCSRGHAFFDAGMRFADADHPLPGSSARRRTYYRCFRCAKCLAVEFERIPDGGGSYGWSSSELLFGATPLSFEEIKASFEEIKAVRR